MPTWNFSKIRPGDKTRDPIQGEFFTSDSIDRSGEALVREGIQNSLDAGADQCVHVRLFVSGESFGVTEDTMSGYCDGIWEHVDAPRNGLKNRPNASEPCPFILFEDFGTSGLEGDINQYVPRADVKNPFYHFVRAEGRSDKGENERGRWGVGKFVFSSASRANTILCATVRANDDRKMLIGQTVLKTHEVSGSFYTPDGFFGVLQDSGLTLPVEDVAEFDSFCRTFNLNRADKPGLSVVIPWHDPEITADAVLAATMVGYFHPILTGRLTVSIETPKESIALTAETFEDEVNKVDQELVGDLASFLPLANHACKHEIAVSLSPPDPRRAAKWSEAMVSDEAREQINATLEAGDCVSVRAPLTVREKPGNKSESHFDIHLQRDSDNHSGRPIFVRGGIIISDVQCSRSRGVRALVIIEDGALAKLLGDAENPSHTRWENGSNFKNKYVYGTSFIKFVSNSANELLRLLSDQEDEADETLLTDYFFLPDGDDSKGDQGDGKKKRKKRKKNVKAKIKVPNRKPPRFQIVKRDGGFEIVGIESESPPDQVDIRVAYDVRRGRALSHYDEADFKIGHNGVSITNQEGVELLSAERNLMSLKIKDPLFRCAVTGFDLERDLYIDARGKEVSDDS